MKILLTGGTGFLGKSILKDLIIKNNYQIALLVRDSKKLYQLDKTKIQIINLNNNHWKKEVGEYNPEVVVHLAAFLTSTDSESSITNLISSNIEFGTHLLDALKNTKIKYFINTGSFSEYRLNNGELNPAYLYAATKTAFRSILSYYQSHIEFNLINVIPYTIYGRQDSQKKMIDIIYASTQSELPIKMSPGEQVLDFIHIDDIVAFYLKLFENIFTFKQPYAEIHLGTAKGNTPKAIAKYIEKLTNRTANIDWGGLPYRETDTMYSVASKNLPKEYINWTPSIDIEEGLKNYIKAIQEKQ